MAPEGSLPHSEAPATCSFFLKYREKFQIPLEISRKFLFGNWQYQSNFRALPTPSLLSGLSTLS